MVKCPVCKQPIGQYAEELAMQPGVMRQVDYPLYQISYPGRKEYVTPRCERCFDRLRIKQEEKKS